MANYRVGDVIRLARKAAGMSQEELAFRAGVATETISRIETGKHKVTQGTYRKIMEQLNWSSERSYAICTSEKLGILEEKKLVNDAENKYDYEKAGKYLEQLKMKTDGNIVDQQFILRTEALVDFHVKKTGAEAMVKKLEEALHLTVEEYEKYLECKEYQNEGYPFKEQEMLILMNLADAYAKLDMIEKSEKIYKMLLQCIDEGYLGGSNVHNLKLVIKRNYGRHLFLSQRYEESIQLLVEALHEAVLCKYGKVIPHILYDITRNMVQINEITGKDIYNIEEIKRIRRQTYYIAAARNDEHVQKIVNLAYQMLFQEDIEK